MSYSRTPTISVVLPVYNAARYLEEAVESVLNQTFGDFELIIINDGSRDSSEDIIQSFAIKDNRITVISRHNKGLISTLNEGIGAAQGEFIARMDADDICAPVRLERQIEFLSNNPDVGVCGTAVEIYYEDPSNNGFSFPPASHADCMARSLFRTPLFHPTAVFRRKTAVENNLYYSADFQHCEDYELWGRWSEHAKLGNIDEVLLKYRVHKQQVSVVNQEVTRNNHIRVVNRSLKRLGLEFDDSTIRSLLSWEMHKNGIEGLFDMFREIEVANQKLQVFSENSLRNELSFQAQRAVSRLYGVVGLLKYLNQDLLKRPDFISNEFKKLLFQSVSRTIRGAS